MAKSYLTDECLAGDKGACSQACPSANRPASDTNWRFLAACAKALQRDSGSFGKFSKGAVRGNKPIELAYARRMPKNPFWIMSLNCSAFANVLRPQRLCLTALRQGDLRHRHGIRRSERKCLCDIWSVWSGAVECTRADVQLHRRVGQ